MSDHSKIEWTDATWNPTTGCTKVSQGCKNCYAERDWKRLSKNPKTVYFGREFTDVQTHSERLDAPIHWTKDRHIFVNSMSDLFHESVPDEFIDRVFEVMAQCPQHTFQVLTKRADRMQAFLSAAHREIPRRSFGYSMLYRNIQLGVSVEDQAAADERIPLLLSTPAAVRFLSMEPLLGATDVAWALSRNLLEIGAGFLRRGRFSPGLEALRPLDWVIAGGESGSKARPSHPDWFRSIRDQCAAAGVPFHFKQWGEYAPGSAGFARNGDIVHSAGDWSVRVGKKAAGRLLDGVEHNGVPS